MKKEDELLFLEEHSSTYSSIPKFINLDRKGKIFYIRKEIVKNFFDKHLGRSNAVKLNDVAFRLGFDSYGNSVNFRAIVSSLVIDDNYPIVSCCDGYYKAIDRSDFNQNIETEEKRIQGISKRIKALVKMRDKLLFEAQPRPFLLEEL